MSGTTEEEFIGRAIAAHARATVQAGAIYKQPSLSASGVEQIGDKRYVVLRDNGGEPMRVYRVRPVDGVLRAMRRWPKELQEGAEQS